MQPLALHPIAIPDRKGCTLTKGQEVGRRFARHAALSRVVQSDTGAPLFDGQLRYDSRRDSGDGRVTCKMCNVGRPEGYLMHSAREKLNDDANLTANARQRRTISNSPRKYLPTDGNVAK